MDSGTSRPDDTTTKSPEIGRRGLLAGLAAGGAALAVPGLAEAARGPRRRGSGNRNAPRGADEVSGSDATVPPAGPDRFSRMFDDHPPFATPDDELRAALVEIGRPGGMLDARDPLDVGPIRLITEPDLSPDNPDNPTHTAGATFMGQFIDHDITSDAGSRLGRPEPVRRSTNLRSARLDLDSVYGGGPTASRELYEADDAFRLRIESGGRFEDLPRDSDGTAIIADGRNDENLVIAGLQCGFLMAHNAILDRVRLAEGGDPLADRVLAETMRTLRWHYQWIVLHELLPQYVGPGMVADVLRQGRRFYTPRVARIPVEFQTSAYRFGHSMIRPSYRANLAGDEGEPFFGFVFDPSQFGVDDPDDLSGGHRSARRFIGWQTFFDFDDGEVKPNKRIDPKLSTPLFQLPMSAVSSTRGEEIGPLSLATRNLLRHITWGIPSGQDVAAAMDVDRLARADLSAIDDVSPALAAATPLWLYVLHEAELAADGLHLGPVGGRIVAEVLIGLLELDPTSFLRVDPDWRPTLPSRFSDDGFTMADLLTMAGVDPDARGQ